MGTEVKVRTYKEDALVLMKIELTKAWRRADGTFDITAASEVVQTKLSNLGRIHGPLWDEQGAEILAGWWRLSDRTLPPIPVEEPDEEDTLSRLFGEPDTTGEGVSSERGREPAHSRKFQVRDSVFDVLITIHEEGKTGQDRFLGDLLPEEALECAAASYRQAAGRQEVGDRWTTFAKMWTAGKARDSLEGRQAEIRSLLSFIFKG